MIRNLEKRKDNLLRARDNKWRIKRRSLWIGSCDQNNNFFNVLLKIVGITIQLGNQKVTRDSLSEGLMDLLIWGLTTSIK